MSKFGRPWPLGRPARAVLFFKKTPTHQSIRDLTRPGPKARRMFHIHMLGFHIYMLGFHIYMLGFHRARITFKTIYLA